MMTTRPHLAHFVLQTNQLAAMREWYLQVLGAHVVYESPVMCFLTFDDEHHRLALFNPPDGGLTERTVMSVGLAHTAFSFGTLGELVEKYLELKAAGIEPRVPVQHGVTTSLYYRDPDANAVELQVDNFATPEQATDYMCGPEYAADPVGPSFDVAELALAYQSGTPESELMSRTWALTTPQVDPFELLTT